MKAVVFERFGDPAEVLQVREVPEPEPGPGQVRVRMLASPIGPADFLTVRGEYGYQPKLPATPGTEGVGIVEAGRGLLGRLRVGRRVAVLNETGGNWQEKVVVSALRVDPHRDRRDWIGFDASFHFSIEESKPMGVNDEEVR